MSDRDRRTSHAVAAGLVLSLLGSVGFVVVYWSDAGTQAEALTLAAAFAGLAVAAGTWGVRTAPPRRVAVAQRPPMPSSRAARRGAAEDFDLDDEGLARRRGLAALAGLAGAAVIAAVATPLRSLGTRPHPALERTSWREGVRLVTADGRPLQIDDLAVDSIATAYPEGPGREAAGDSQVILVRMPESALELPAGRASWAPAGCVAYSKVCTHAGCPVGLYEADRRELLCPCHQSTFRAAEGATVSFGPAGRALPQLPLAVDDEGYLVARSDFTEPVGPGYWSRG